MRRIAPFCAVLALVAGLTAAATTSAVAETAASASPPAAGASPAQVGSAAPASGSSSPSWLASHGQNPSPAPGSASVSSASVSPRPAPDAEATTPSHLTPTAAAEQPAPNGKVQVSVSGSAATVAAQVKRIGGRVVVAANGISDVSVPAAQLDALASAPGVKAVAPVNHPYLDDTDPPANQASQAVAASGAGAWQAAPTPITGSGVKVAIVDAGFGDDEAQYDAEITAHHLGAGTTVINEGCATDPDDPINTATPYPDEAHGLAVAEVLQQQAPDATLFLYCVASPEGVANAESDIEAKNIKIVSSSLSWVDDARGDGTGPDGSVAATVEKARKAGILWIESAGNYADQHWSGTLTDSNKDKLVDLGNASSTTYPYQSDFFMVAPGSGASPTSVDFNLQWDEWPLAGANDRLYLQAYGLQCEAPFGSGGNDNCNGLWITQANPARVDSVPGTIPTIDLDTSLFRPNYGQYPQIWQVQIVVPAGYYPVGAHYDLLALGDTYSVSTLACPSENTAGDCNIPAPARTGSITSPSNSPYAMAVGAVDVGADGEVRGTLEPFSSQGPTVDGRVKPDIAGWDGLSSYVSDFSDGFYGTSAATPAVAGAAALVAQANPTMDAAQIQNFLEQRANGGAPANPPTNQEGHGPLTLGATPTTTPVANPVGSRYVALAGPVGVLDTRTTLGGHHGMVAAGQSFTVTMPAPANIPSNATAVVLELAGANATAQTYISAWAGGIPWPGTSNVNLTTLDATATVTSVITVGSSAQGKTIQVRNNNGKANIVASVVGYFAPGSGAGFVTVPTTQILDTRSSLGGHQAKIPTNGSALVATGLPSDAIAAVVNVTSTDTTVNGYLSATSDCSRASGVVNYTKYTRADMAIVPLNASKQICVSASDSPADAVVALVGYLTSTPGNGASYVALPSSVLEVDTQSGNGGRHTPISGGQRQSYQGDGIFDVPYTASALMVNLAAANATSAGYLTLVPGGTTTIATSTLNMTPNRVVSNSAIVPTRLPNGDYEVANSAGAMRAVVSVSGYFI